MDSLLSVQDICKTYTDRVIDALSFEILVGENFFLVGPSGCGKSTLLAMIAGLVSPDSGTIIINGKDVTQHRPQARPVRTVFQDYLLFPHLTLDQNIAFSLRATRLPKKEIESRVTEMISLLELEGLEKRRPNELSGGQQQRTAIGRALVSKPPLLLFDEALSASDYSLSYRLVKRIIEFKEDYGGTFCFVSHNLEDAFRYGSRMAILSDGKFAQIGTPFELYHNPKTTFVAGFLGAVNVFDLTNSHQRHFLRVESDVGKATVRPQHIQVLPFSDEAQLHGTIVDIVFQGEKVTLHVGIEGLDFEVLAALKAGQSDAPTLGDTVSLSIDAEHIVEVPC